MKSTDLAVIISPFAALANKHAMSPIYNTLEISADTIRGCAPWGVLEVDAEIGTKETFWVNSLHFVGVIKTLPAGEVVFSQTGTTLSWECGNAQGKLGLLPKLEIPNYEWEGPATEKPNIDNKFPEALTLGSLSASRDIGMSSAGVTGVALTWLPAEEDPNGTHGTVYIASSDNVTMSVSSTEIVGAMHWPENIVINTEAAGMLSTILRMSAGSSGAFLDIQEKIIIAYANDFRLMIRSAPPMKHDILMMTQEYPREEIVMDLPSDVVKRFVARASALAEAKNHTHVRFAASSGGLRLSFAEGALMSDEQYNIAELVLPNEFPEVRLDASRLARALGHADKLALDAFSRGVLTLFTGEGVKPEFSYLINGAQEKGA